MKENEIKCSCINAVRNTYNNLIKQDYRPADALFSAMKVLKYHHPEIADHKIGKRTAAIINPELEVFLETNIIHKPLI